MNESAPNAALVRDLALLVSLAGLAGCGGQSGAATTAIDAGTTEVNGTIDGIGLTRAYAVAVPDNSNASGGIGGPTDEYTRLVLGIANQPLTCGTGNLPNSSFLGISITTQGTLPVGLGSYSIETNLTSSLDNVAALIVTDSTCTEASPAGVVGGTVMITTVTDSVIAGSFTLAFDSGEALHGTFAAPVCAALPAWLRGVAC